MTKTKIARIGLLTLVTLGFLTTGSLKLIGSQFEIGLFTGWGYPIWFMYVIGTCEVLGAIGLHVKKVSRLAAICLILLLCGAVYTHVSHHETSHAVPATILMLSLFGILYLDTKKSMAQATATAPVA